VKKPPSRGITKTQLAISNEFAGGFPSAYLRMARREATETEMEQKPTQHCTIQHFL